MSCRFLLLSHNGAGLPLAYRLQEEGSEVIAWIQVEKYRSQYKGLLRQVEDWHSAIGHDTIVVMDHVAVGTPDEERPEDEEEWEAYEAESSKLMEAGIPVVGGSSLTDRMELDRTWGAKLAQEAGLLVPKATKFEDFEEAKDFVEQTKQRYILKPHGNQETFQVYPAEGWRDMVAMLEHFQETFPPGPFELQEFVEGTQLSIEGWWTGEAFVGLNSTFEHKPHYSTDIGAFTGETGSLIFYYPDGVSNKLAEETLLKLTPVLRKLNLRYYGPIDVNCILNEEGAHFLEFTARFGYPALYLQLCAVEDRWSKVLEQLADGTFEGFHPKPWHWTLGSRVWIPKWPYGETEKTLIGAPLFGRIRPEWLDRLHFVDIQKKDGWLVTGGTDGELMTVVEQGNSIEEARGKLYQLLHDLYLYPMGWRSDLGVTALDHLEDIRRWGYWTPSER